MDIKTVARMVGENGRGLGPKVYIAAVYEAAKTRGYQGSLDSFKVECLNAHKAGKIVLSRADMGARQLGWAEKVATEDASVTRDGNAMYHYVRVD